MSGILALVRHDGSPTPPDIVRSMLEAMAHRGGDKHDIWQEGGVVLAVQRAAWEFDADFSGPVLVTVAKDVVVAADARLYYRDDLRRKLASRGVRASGQTPSHLILAAYQAFGDACAEELEGDFAFIVWDRRRRMLIASRDFTGMRPLLRASVPDGQLFASTIGGLLAHPECNRELDLDMIAHDAAGSLFGSADGTAYRVIRHVPAGGSIVVTGRGEPSTRRWFHLPEAEGLEPRRLEEAAEGLRDVLRAAVNERMAVSSPTAVWVSGGFDSPAILALATEISRREGRAIRQVSMSFPEGNTAREDELISQIAAHLGHTARWADGSALPLLGVDLTNRSWPEDEPFTHLNSEFLEMLAVASREEGTRVALSGHAGDFLFQCGPYFLSDLLRRGRLPELAREWGAMDVQEEQRRRFWKFAVEPMLPDNVRRALGRARGRPLVAPFERQLPSWIKASVGRPDRATAALPRFAAEGACAAEFRWYLTNPGFARLHAATTLPTVTSGIEMRSPMHDSRVIRFAAKGPRTERYSMGQKKRLLRESMRPLLPKEVLAGRTFKTGTLSSHLASSALAAIPRLRELFDSPLLADLGLVEPTRLRASLSRLESRRIGLPEAEALLWTGITEAWLRRWNQRETLESVSTPDRSASFV